MFRDLFGEMTPVVKNLVLINVVLFVASMAVPWVSNNLLTYNINSWNFRPYQVVTHFFMHGGIFHIFFNLSWIVFLGSKLEKIWGAKRFLFFYLLCGLGSWLCSSAVNEYQFFVDFGDWSWNVSYDVVENSQFLVTGESYPAEWVKFYEYSWYRSLGASGAVMGIIAAFAFLFPNTSLNYFGFDIKMKYFALFILGVDLFLANANFQWDNIGHYAHLGGALFGFILVWIWQQNKSRMY